MHEFFQFRLLCGQIHILHTVYVLHLNGTVFTAVNFINIHGVLPLEPWLLFHQSFPMHLE